MLIGSILFGLPVAFARLRSAITLMLPLDLFNADILAQSLINGIDSFPLLATPFFLVAGKVMSAGGLSLRILRLATAMIGHRKGGLGYLAVFTAVPIAGLSGSAVADAAALVAIVYPMTEKANDPEARRWACPPRAASSPRSFRRRCR